MPATAVVAAMLRAGSRGEPRMTIASTRPAIWGGALRSRMVFIRAVAARTQVDPLAIRWHPANRVPIPDVVMPGNMPGTALAKPLAFQGKFQPP